MRKERSFLISEIDDTITICPSGSEITEAIERLADHIQMVGLKNPILLMKYKGENKYRIHDGWMRVQAYKLLGLRLIKGIAHSERDIF